MMILTWCEASELQPNIIRTSCRCCWNREKFSQHSQSGLQCNTVRTALTCWHVSSRATLPARLPVKKTKQKNMQVSAQVHCGPTSSLSSGGFWSERRSSPQRCLFPPSARRTCRPRTERRPTSAARCPAAPQRGGGGEAKKKKESECGSQSVRR